MAQWPTSQIDNKELPNYIFSLKAMDVFVTTSVLQATQHNLQIRSFFAGFCNVKCQYESIVKFCLTCLFEE